MKKVYLDYASITPTDKRVFKVIKKHYGAEYGNPSSIHGVGVKAIKVVEEARKKCAHFLRAHADEIIFTASGTEANVLAIEGPVRKLFENGRAYSDMHIITSKIEHQSILEPVAYLARLGMKVDYIGVDQMGIFDLVDLKKKLRPETVLVSLMMVNNEIGTIQRIREIAKVIRHLWAHDSRFTIHDSRMGNTKPIFHTDASQAPLYLELDTNLLGVDMITLDGHKVYGPKGIGMLYIKRGTELVPIISGGGQENGLRSGTENVPAIAGLAVAFEIAEKEREKESARLTILRDLAISKILAQIPGVVLNGDKVSRLPNNINISIPNIDAEFLVLQLDARGIQCSTKSSCLKDESESYVIRELKGEPWRAKNSIRLSLGRKTTKNDIEYVIKELVKAVGKQNIKK
jgi:cysteine desulfurase